MKKSDGFKEQISVVLPGFIINELRNDPISERLYLTDIGYYPKAQHHLRERESGCSQSILIYCIEGKGWVSIKGKKMPVNENQYFIIPNDTAHSYGSNNNNPWSIYWVHYSGSLASYFSDSFQNPQTISPSNLDRIDDRIQLFKEMINNLEMGYSKENVQYANICLLHFLASFKLVSQFRQIRKIEENDTVGNVVSFMKRNLDKKHYLSELAEVARLSVSHFSLLFRTKTGRAPMDYLTHLRIQRACQYLDNSSLQVNEISLEVGFEDPFHFSRVFKQVMGVSPVYYRKKPKG